ncbi:hypothetical protein LPB138_05155 [Urechidicola croceus]|uniref:Glycosyl transferase n=2 Tax=Urechidicola croceus TaxID=1850246 RepID=A0A1D8PBT1_9FLAO|nr:hypothetical protein LPB138_05155 [Urechidicola croceus]
MKFKNLVTSDEQYAKKIYRKRFKKELNLDNPKTFNEKIQWLKLNDRTPVHTICADKIAVRDYVKERIGEEYLIPLEKVFSSASELIPENITDEYPVIIKCNHNSGAYTIVKNKEDIDWRNERLKYSNLLKQNYYHQGREWQYKDIEPKLFAEKLLTDEKGSIPKDYKIFCFDGEPKFIQVDIDRQINHLRNFYDTDWNLMPVELIYGKGDDVEKPKQLEKMLKLAKELGKDFVFARVDFYTFGNEIYFGEITFHPESGFGKFNENNDFELGKYLSLEKLK